MSDPGVQLYFKVTVDKSHVLGLFTACDGLGVEVVMEQREEGGNNDFIHQLPVRMKYTNLKLTRPFDRDTAMIARWFASMSGKIVRTTAAVTAQTADNLPIGTWSFTGVLPVRWQGPSFSVESAKVATETLELAHHGFTYREGA